MGGLRGPQAGGSRGRNNHCLKEPSAPQGHPRPPPPSAVLRGVRQFLQKTHTMRLSSRAQAPLCHFIWQVEEGGSDG